MPARRIAAVVSPFLDLINWLFSGLFPCVDLFLGLLGSCWLWLMVVHSDVFDRGNLQGMQWLPDRLWLAFISLMVLLHLMGLVRPSAIKLRVGAILLTSWYWILISISLARTGLSTGPFTYALIGVFALMAAIYISGQQPTRRA